MDHTLTEVPDWLLLKEMEGRGWVVYSSDRLVLIRPTPLIKTLDQLKPEEFKRHLDQMYPYHRPDIGKISFSFLDELLFAHPKSVTNEKIMVRMRCTNRRVAMLRMYRCSRWLNKRWLHKTPYKIIGGMFRWVLHNANVCIDLSDPVERSFTDLDGLSFFSHLSYQFGINVTYSTNRIRFMDMLLRSYPRSVNSIAMMEAVWPNPVDMPENPVTSLVSLAYNINKTLGKSPFIIHMSDRTWCLVQTKMGVKK